MNTDMKCKIMFLDPDSSWLSNVKTVLEERGLTAQVFNSPEKLVHAIKGFHNEPRLAFLDLIYLEKNTEIINQLTNLSNLFIVVMTPPDFMPYQISRVFKIGVHDCVEKPFSTNLLIDMVTVSCKEVFSSKSKNLNIHLPINNSFLSSVA